jgi:hypothetical protein
MTLIEFDSGAQRNVVVIGFSRTGLSFNAGQLLTFHPRASQQETV